MPLSIGLLGQTLIAVALFGLMILPVGTLAALLLPASLYSKTHAERGLWSLALGFPLATLLAVAFGRLDHPALTLSLFAGLFAGAVAHILRNQGGLHFDWRQHRAALFVLAVCCVYGLLATASVSWHGRRYEPVLSNDWYIRIPLLQAAAHSAVPPINPLYTLHGANPSLRYYYFFYVLCALPMRLGHLSADSVLSAGVLWSTLTFFAVAWLLLRHVVLPASPGFAGLRWRTVCLLFVPVSLITGLDVLPTLLTPALGGPLQPAIYWWNANDGVNAWPGLVSAAPHHLVGMCMALVAYLLLSLPVLSLPTETSRQGWMCAILSGLALAAALGASTFVACGVLVAIALLAAERLVRRQFAAAAMTLAAAAVALLLEAPLLLAGLRGRAITGALTHRHLPLALVLRNWHHAYGLSGLIFAHLLHRPQPHGLLAYVAALPVLAVLYAVDLGFFAWIAYEIASTYFAAHKTAAANDATRSLGCLLAAFALLSTFVSSAPMQSGLNDLARHNLFALRTLLALLACPLLAARYLAWRQHRQKEGRPRPHFTLPATLALVGLAGTLYDVTVQRVYLPLVDAGLIRPVDPFLFAPGIALRYQQLGEAWAAIDQRTPPAAVVQGNPDGPLQRPFLRYLNRRVAAGDASCESDFGGDASLCRTAIVRPLLALYAQPDNSPANSSSPRLTSSANFAALCAELQLTALVATDYDPVWRLPESWVWHAPALYASPTVRVLRCSAERPFAAQPSASLRSAGQR